MAGGRGQGSHVAVRPRMTGRKIMGRVSRKGKKLPEKLPPGGEGPKIVEKWGGTSKIVFCIKTMTPRLPPLALGKSPAYGGETEYEERRRSSSARFFGKTLGGRGIKSFTKRKANSS